MTGVAVVAVASGMVLLLGGALALAQTADNMML